jgi:hypothetical protein
MTEAHRLAITHAHHLRYGITEGLAGKTKGQRRRIRMAERNRKLLREHKNKSCADCGLSYPWYVMDFDHVSGTKKFQLSNAFTRSLRILREELAKCELVCANCHRIRTFKKESEA